MHNAISSPESTGKKLATLPYPLQRRKPDHLARITFSLAIELGRPREP